MGLCRVSGAFVAVAAMLAISGCASSDALSAPLGRDTSMETIELEQREAKQVEETAEEASPFGEGFEEASGDAMGTTWTEFGSVMWTRGTKGGQPALWAVFEGMDVSVSDDEKFSVSATCDTESGKVTQVVEVAGTDLVGDGCIIVFDALPSDAKISEVGVERVHAAEVDSELQEMRQTIMNNVTD